VFIDCVVTPCNLILQKYYPPDFDPSKIPRMKLPRNRQYTVRLMAPFNMRWVYNFKWFSDVVTDSERLCYHIFFHMAHQSFWARASLLLKFRDQADVNIRLRVPCWELLWNMLHFGIVNKWYVVFMISMRRSFWFVQLALTYWIVLVTLLLGI
jgi:hypothetical protein